MNQKKAKKLRKEIYQDMSLKGKQEYFNTGTEIRCSGLRGVYQNSKKLWYLSQKGK